MSNTKMKKKLKAFNNSSNSSVKVIKKKTNNLKTNYNRLRNYKSNNKKCLTRNNLQKNKQRVNKR